MDKKTRFKNFIWLVVILLDFILILSSKSTYDSGDSVLHYLFSHQAIDYPIHLMNHWAKPLFVLLSAPFAFWGFVGMKIFNTICILLSTWYCSKLFKEYGINEMWALLLCFAAPQYILVQSSGLTEPLFTLGLISIVYYLKVDRIKLALILLSFLPFVRSEGWIIMPIVAVYLFQIKQWKKLPWIALGTLVYGLAGIAVYSDFLWMFHQNPYSGVEEKYGSGHALHYVNQLMYVIGVPLYFFLFLGCFNGIRRVMNRSISQHEFFIIYGIAVGYFVAHTIFWTQGWFHSFGLNRVLIVLVPLIAFIAYRGIDQIICAFGFIKAKWIYFPSILILMIFPFLDNKASLNIPQDFQLDPDQILAQEVKSYTDSAFGNRPIYYGNTYFPMIYEADIDDPNSAIRIGKLKSKPLQDHALVIWDSYFSVTDQNVNKEDLNRSDLKFIKRFECSECKNSYFVELYEVVSK
ncbi:hypothetical protein GYB22_06010 [bacterium]|nr:hypothetical protein [bacterium]